MARKLASIQVVEEIRPIEGADAIEAIRINDWWCVAKKGEFEVNSACVYFEIDSLLPETEKFAFLAKNGTKTCLQEDGTTKTGYRLKTVRLRGQLSQGLALPASSFFDVIPEVGTDVTDILGVGKYEAPISATLSGDARGNFPSFLRKSDQERCQNLRRSIWDAYEAETHFQVSVKLDGSSITIFNIKEGKLADELRTEPRFGVCSRNLELKESESSFWMVAKEHSEDFLRMDGMAIQGELVAPNIQGNFEGVSKPTLYVYNGFDIKTQKFLPPEMTEEFCIQTDIKHVPILYRSISLKQLFPDATQDTIIEKLLAFADGPSSLGGKYREGLVFKSIDGSFSFKSISNRYLLGEK